MQLISALWSYSFLFLLYLCYFVISVMNILYLTSTRLRGVYELRMLTYNRRGLVFEIFIVV